MKLSNSYIGLPEEFYQLVDPSPVKDPSLIIYNQDLAASLKIDLEKEEVLKYFSGNEVPNGSVPIALNYAGHQFGNFVHQLGDGRAVLLGEISNKSGSYDVQLKGSGQTMFSRQGDGRSALGPVIREYILSEAMHNLGISSTRALAVITTGENVLRDRLEPGAILIRVANSHIRVGTFQFGSLLKNREEFQNFISYTISRLYPDIDNNNDKYLKFYETICDLQIKLVVDWMRVGFIHGVMNTDNMSLSGETIDYGPAAYLDEYNPKKVFSSIDKMGRYSFENQSKITLWNLARFAETFLHLIDSNEKKAIKKIEDILNKYKNLFDQSWLIMMSMKLNLDTNNNNEEIVKEFLDLMHIYKLDYTNTFLDLENNTLDKKIFKNWEEKYKNNKIRKFKNVNPQIIPRNHIIEEIINEVYSNNYVQLYEFEKLLKNPYEKIENKKYITPPLESEKVFETFCGT